MSKKLIIIISIVTVLIGAGVFGVILVRTRILSDSEGLSTSRPLTPQVDGEEAEPFPNDISNNEASFAPVYICGDNLCSEGEKNCSIDCGDGEAFFRSSLFTKSLSPTSVGVQWKTKESSTGILRYGTTTAVNEGQMESETPLTEHDLTVTGLTPGKTYYFSISVTEGDSKYEYEPFIHESN